MKIQKLLSAALACSFSSLLIAAQPMSEADMDNVSAVAGLNLLNIYGAPSAGLKVDTEENASSTKSSSNNRILDDASVEITGPLSVESYQEGETTQDFASQELTKIEEGRLNQEQGSISSFESSLQSSAIIDDRSTIGEAQAFTTSSEISYKDRNVHHEMTELGNGAVSVSRNLQIDLLKIENLRGAHHEEHRSAGSIYLSDWSSRGDTRLTPR